MVLRLLGPKIYEGLPSIFIASAVFFLVTPVHNGPLVSYLTPGRGLSGLTRAKPLTLPVAKSRNGITIHDPRPFAGRVQFRIRAIRAGSVSV